VAVHQGNRKVLYRGCRYPDKHHSFMGNPILLTFKTVSASGTAFAGIRRMHALPAFSGEGTRMESEIGRMAHEKKGENKRNSLHFWEDIRL